MYSGSLWINKDIFDKYGLKAPKTLAEWKNVSAKLAAAGQGGFVQGAGQWAFDMDTFEAIMQNVEPGLYVDASLGKAKYSAPQFVKGMEIWKSLFDQGIMQSGAVGLQQYPDANNAFMSGQYAMVMMGSWYTQYTVKGHHDHGHESRGRLQPDAVHDDSDPVSPMWRGPATSARCSATPTTVSRSAASLAIRPLRQPSRCGSRRQPRVSRAVANTLNDIPSLKGVQPQWDNIKLANPAAQLKTLQDYTDTASSADQPRFATVSADLNTAFRDALIGVATGKVSIKDALTNLQTVADASRK